LSTRLRRSSRTATIFGGEISEVQNFSILGNRFSARGGSMLLAMFVCPSFPFQLRSRCGYSFGLARFNPLVRIGKLKDNISSLGTYPHVGLVRRVILLEVARGVSQLSWFC